MLKRKFLPVFLSLLTIEQLATLFVVRLRPQWINSADRYMSGIPAWLSGASGVVLLVLLYKYFLRGKGFEVPVALMAAGLVGNLLSVALYGRFVDYIPWGSSRANLADLLIVLGGVFVIFFYKARTRDGGG